MKNDENKAAEKIQENIKAYMKIAMTVEKANL